MSGLKEINKQDIILIITTLLRIGLGVMFLISSIAKIRMPYDFLGNVYDFEIVGPKLGILIATVLPWLELFVGACLIGGVFISGALLLSVVMSIMFAAVISSAVARGLSISCGCFGSSQSLLDYLTILRSVAIFMVTIIGWLMHLKFNLIFQN